MTVGVYSRVLHLDIYLIWLKSINVIFFHISSRLKKLNDGHGNRSNSPTKEASPGRHRQRSKSPSKNSPLKTRSSLSQVFMAPSYLVGNSNTYYLVYIWMCGDLLYLYFLAKTASTPCWRKWKQGIGNGHDTTRNVQKVRRSNTEVSNFIPYIAELTAI